MKDEWLMCGVCLCLLSVLPFYASIVLIIGIVLYHKKRFSYGIIKFICICILFFVRTQYMHPTYIHNVNKEIKIKEIKENYAIGFNGQQKVLVYGLNHVSYDDVVLVKGTYKKIDSVSNEGQFDFTKWANRKGIYESINARKFKVLKEGKSVRSKLFKYIQTLTKDKAKFINGLLYGIYEDDQYPLITASGMHISFLLSILTKIWKNHIEYKKGQMINFIILCMIAQATVISASIFRLLCFQIIKIVSSDNPYDQIGKSIILMLFYNPNYVYEIGFLTPILFRIIFLFNVQKRNKYVLSFLVLFPIQMYFFHSCDLVQMLIFPILRLIYAILYLLAWILLLSHVEFIVFISYKLLAIIKNVNSTSFYLYGSVHAWWLILWLISSLYFISYKFFWNSIRMIMLFVLFFVIPYLSPFVTITMLDVGQGDCTLIQMPYQREVYMIDIIGNRKKNIPQDIIVPYLRAQGIYKIDQLLITHHDFDHCGGLEELQELIPIDVIIDNKKTAKKYQKTFMKYLLLDYQGEDENDNSIVTLLKVFNKTALFMGDLGKKGERELMMEYPKLEADILKAGHHGSNTSSSSTFLHQIQPAISLISCGRNNIYKHPNQEVLETMEKEKIYSIITKNHGGCIIKIGKYFSYFKTAKGQYGLL